MLSRTSCADFRVLRIVVILLGACTYDLPNLELESASSSGLGGSGAAEQSSSSSSQGGEGGFNGGTGGISSGMSSASSGAETSSSASSSSSSSGSPVVPPVFVQVAYTTPQTNQIVATATYSKAQTAGNTNILAIGWNDTTSVLTNVKDTAGNVYQQALGTFASATMSQAIYYASNIAATQPGSNSVLVTFNAAASFIDLRITEYSGLSNTNPFDTGTSKSGIGTVAKTDIITTTLPAELLFAAGMTRGHFNAAGTNYIERVITSPDGDIVQDRIAFAPMAHLASAPLTDSEWLLQLLAFRPAP